MRVVWIPRQCTKQSRQKRRFPWALIVFSRTHWFCAIYFLHKEVCVCALRTVQHQCNTSDVPMSRLVLLGGGVGSNPLLVFLGWVESHSIKGSL